MPDCVAATGREFWVVGNAVVTGRDSARGGGSQITFALLDIERRREAEASIAQAQASLQRIIETAPLAIALFDARQRPRAAPEPDGGHVLRPAGGRGAGPAARWCGLHPPMPPRCAPNWPRPACMPTCCAASSRGPAAPRAMASCACGTCASSRWRPLAASRRCCWWPATSPSSARPSRPGSRPRCRSARCWSRKVHHRIKNNLQGVAGLLQQTAARRPEVAHWIPGGGGPGAGHRPGARAAGGGVGAAAGAAAAGGHHRQRAAHLRPAIEVLVEGLAAHRFALPEAESIPIALTINELLTNAVKHGLPGAIRCTWCARRRGCR